MKKKIILYLSIIILICSGIIYSFSPYISSILEKSRLLNKYDSKLIKFDYDLIVVGSGLAGLTAAYESTLISNNSIKIAIIEKAPKFGGNSAKATSGINILQSPLQEKQKIKDSSPLFVNDTMKSGKFINDLELVNTVVNDSHFLYDFYTKEVNADLTKLGLLGGHSVPRTVRPTKATIGFHLVSQTYNKLINLKNVNFIFNAELTSLKLNIFGNKVIGIQYKNVNENNNNDNSDSKFIELKSKAVILATGGYGHDFGTKDSLLKEYVPNLMKFPTTNSPYTKGEGMKVARKIGIAMRDMEQVQVHPTGFVNLEKRFEKNKILAPELLRGVGGILLNQKGKRFVNELGTRDYVTAKIIENCDLIKNKEDNITQYEAFLLLNEKSIQNYGGDVNFYIKKGFLRKYESLKDFSLKMNISYESMVDTINEYNKASDLKKDSFGKTNFPMKFDLKDYIYVGVITPSIHYCMGGIKINKNSEVIKNNGKIMGGLFAAGEVTGGVHGGNRLGGNSLMECGVYGRRAGKAAIEYINTYN